MKVNPCELGGDWRSKAAIATIDVNRPRAPMAADNSGCISAVAAVAAAAGVAKVVDQADIDQCEMAKIDQGAGCIAAIAPIAAIAAIPAQANPIIRSRRAKTSARL